MGDPDTLVSTFIKPGKINDRGQLAQTLVNNLPQEQQSLPGYAYLSRAYVPDPITGTPTFNPMAFSKLYNNIGTNTKDALFGSGPLRQQLDNYNNLVGMNKNSLMSKNNANISDIGGAAAGAGILGTAFHMGGALPAVHAALPLAGASVGARYLNKYLTSPQTAQNILNNLQPQVAQNTMAGAITKALLTSKAFNYGGNPNGS